MLDTCQFYWLYPGWLAGSAYPGSCLKWLYQEMGIRSIVSLHPLGLEDRQQAEQLGMKVTTVPIRDFEAGTRKQRKKVLQAIRSSLTDAAPTLVHCKGGLGRTGMALALYLVREKGIPAKNAIATIRRLRSGSIETVAQEEAILQEDPEP